MASGATTKERPPVPTGTPRGRPRRVFTAASCKHTKDKHDPIRGIDHERVAKPRISGVVLRHVSSFPLSAVFSWILLPGYLNWLALHSALPPLCPAVMPAVSFASTKCHMMCLLAFWDSPVTIGTLCLSLQSIQCLALRAATRFGSFIVFFEQ